MPRLLKPPLESADVLSDCGTYRYLLNRRVAPEGRTYCYIGYNPSKADQSVRDPTDRKCEGFTRVAHGGDYWIVNPFAYRATEPKDLDNLLVKRGEAVAVGPENDAHLIRLFEQLKEDGGVLVAAWGALGSFRLAKPRIRRLVALARASGLAVHSLGLTKEGHPRHPLMVAYKQAIEPLPTSWIPPQ